MSEEEAASIIRKLAIDERIEKSDRGESRNYQALILRELRTISADLKFLKVVTIIGLICLAISILASLLPG